MITTKNFKPLLHQLDFIQSDTIFTKKIRSFELKVDFKSQKITYPEGLKINRETTTNFSQPENFVVFECIYSLLNAGYEPSQIELEAGTHVGHKSIVGHLDILVRDNQGNDYLLIECKTTDEKDSKLDKAWKDTLKDGGQLFNYFNTYRQAKYLCLYASDFKDGVVNQDYYLISMQDNDEFLKSDKDLLSFAKVKAKNAGKESYFKVWQKTYNQDAISHGLFESKPFAIGKLPFSTEHLKTIDEAGIQKKYHQFATIMRQHNVSSRENAFDKLVNLFLAKIIDEKQNPNALKVYWNGAAYDNFYSLQDRLQELYAVGMREFLKEEITYIKDEAIENAFVLFKNDPDETKKKILEKFRQLKFYTNNDFAFLDVHNENLFYKNAAILKEIVQMLQDIRLVNENEQNQFLGDLFEGFLDQGVKQNEGQFFTPMPIVRFIVSSLPLSEIFEQEAMPKAIDYACGAGHFLTEYASQIKPIIEAKSDDLKEFYSNIHGIEKEYRLSKVAKVSAFMYGQDDITIIYGDALGNQSEITNNSYSVLIANPPYSVKGFLNTLSEKEREQFTLFDGVDKLDSNNAIEAFFIERAKQLLKQNGVAGIVLPSSILSNGNIYIKVREILLSYFDIVAIAEFGSGTFGKTGTNTVTLFLRRKSTEIDYAEHYKNRVKAWFGGNFKFDGVFEDSDLLDAYCQHCSFGTTDYRQFLSDGILFENEVFTAYAKKFENSSEYKNLIETKKFKDLDELAKNREKTTALIAYIKVIEAEKLNYFILAHQVKTPVLVITAPSDNKANKQFLGYEWSSRKGDEGIKYLSGGAASEDTALTSEQGINKIQTPLFNPKTPNDTSKLNFLIQQNFSGSLNTIPEHLTAFAKHIPLVEMLDFSRTSFDKAIRTSVQKKIEIKSKYPLVRLDAVVNIIRGVTYSKTDQVTNRTKNIILPADNISLEGELIIKKEIFLSDNLELDKDKKLAENDIFVCFSSGSEKHVGKMCFISADTDYYAGGFMGILRNINNEAIQKYLFNLLNQESMRNAVRLLSNGTNIKNLSNSLGELKIPLPPLNIQKRIIKECEKIDEEYENSRMKIEEYRAKIARIFNDLEIIMGGGSKAL